MKYEETLIKIRVNGTNDPEISNWAREKGMNAYNKWAKFANKHFISIYNWIWNLLYPNEDMDNHSNYDRIYLFCSNCFMNVVLLFTGGILMERRIKVNALYDFTLGNKSNPGICDNMLYVIWRGR